MISYCARLSRSGKTKGTSPIHVCIKHSHIEHPFIKQSAQIVVGQQEKS